MNAEAVTWIIVGLLVVQIVFGAIRNTKDNSIIRLLERITGRLDKIPVIENKIDNMNKRLP